MAISIENRYKGLRAPHKLKMAVSGCTRECAEAQGKDVGVIATEKGWNLYVCGNGGMKPRHADLLASDLDEETLIQLHRPLPDVLHPHRRPAAAHPHVAARTWRAASTTCAGWSSRTALGIARRAGGRHAARWSTPTSANGRRRSNDPEKLKRFRHFVNSDEAGPQRGVRRGARADPAGAARGARTRRRTSLEKRHERAMAGCRVCPLEDIVPTAGVCALRRTASRWRCSALGDDSVHAIGNHDPARAPTCCRAASSAT